MISDYQKTSGLYLLGIGITSEINMCKMVRKTELKSISIPFYSFNIMLLDPRLVDSGSTMILIGAYNS